MIQVHDLTRGYDAVTALDHVTFDVQPGTVTGFLGPNGAGKSTTMRLILGLERPDAGTALVDGGPYRQLDQPMRHIGALLDANAVDGTRSGADHLRWLAHSNAIPASRIPEVLDQVGLSAAADRRVGHYSLGMRQRLGIASALLGDPTTLLLDEPINGLDPDGIVWLRHLLRAHADRGGTVLVSSHLMDEVAHVADHVIVIGAGHVLADAPLADVVAGHRAVHVRTSRRDDLAAALRGHGATVSLDGADGITVTRLDAAAIGVIAGDQAIALSELAASTTSLEDAFFALTDSPAALHAVAPGA
jgi:ABC-2 type transport system ATP-binding protein